LINKISGRLLSVANDTATIAIDAFEYEVLIPEFARLRLQHNIGRDVSLFTIHYLDGNPAHGRLTPRLVGFTGEVEREFFELICSVDGLGVKKALRAMVRPVKEVAELIESQDAKGLSALPGIGSATAERIIAKLRRKMPKFVLMVSREEMAGDVPTDVAKEAFDVLCKLGHSETDARKLLDGALADRKKFSDVEALLQAVYQKSHAR
jgi:Holliday junction DNA helicase RuvA